MKIHKGKVNNENLKKIVAAYNQGKVIGNFLPAVFVLEPISKCSLSCIMCPNSKLSEDALGIMSISEFERITKLISPFAEHVMLYFMGEPLEHPDFVDIVKIARKQIKGILTISTNCMLLNDEFAAAILVAPIDLLICCIDHWNKKDYERIRVGGKFHNVVSNVEEFLKKKNNSKQPIVVVKSLDFGMDQNERKNFESYWESRGAIPLIGWIDSWAGQFPGLRRQSKEPQPYISHERKPCADLWFKMIINWRSEVVICCHNYDYSIPLGKLKNNKDILASVWHGPLIVDLRTEHSRNNFDCNRLCKGCTEWGLINELDIYCNLKLSDLFLVF